MSGKMKLQAHPKNTIPIDKEQFNLNNETAIYWLGSAGILINSHGTIILMDPVLDQIEENGNFFNELNGLKMFNQIPIKPEDIPRVDAILYTHADDDHLGTKTPSALLHTGAIIHCPVFVKKRLIELGVPGERIITHKREDKFNVNDIEIEMTIADHPWQKIYPEKYNWHYTIDDCTGFKLKTKDGVIWNPGDSILQSEHLNQQNVDVLFIDFSADPYHFGVDGAIELANRQRNAVLIPFHWGTYESEKPAFNANPVEYVTEIEENKRMCLVAIGEKYRLAQSNNSTR